ncbi:amino acid deaminase/aldolase [Yinghuangia seranimata]|uniref:amino acid deaminase/aldolase n=1 Tax=Yinghuangia seranimata TaxID=408067 RepID=UPI00248B18F6|nr:amino acid deaminase/aldolase [Yinghuangia seranimata]MDI2126666.1 amino acid deaminase/aldolase [Yinghuangia seranimata]
MASITAPRSTHRPSDDRARYDRATAHLDAPFAIVDVEAFRANAADLVRRAAGKPVRIASKSVRCLPLLREALATDGFAGVMAFTLPEALWLAAEGCEDVLVAYPSTDRAAYAALAADPVAAARVTVMVDDVAQLDFIDRHRGDGTERIRVCVDIDCSWQPFGGRVRVGAHRSPLHTPDQVADVAEQVVKRPQFHLVGLMAYEAQIAGVGDAPAGRALYGRAIRFMQARAGAELAARRAEIVRAVRQVAELEFVNGGGTGSVERTVAEPSVTEVAAGSGLYQPRLFDDYTSFSGRPAALFALPVVRRPGMGWVSVLGGGYPASGAAGRDRLPTPYLPAGLAYDPQEGPGEVQTPLRGAAADDLLIGDRVWFRHAKAGELCERFDALHLVEGDRVVGTVPTYRGEGKTFL